jgi:threonine dehydrogenase-like Zn-dependent dehydrogenase
LPDDVPFDVGVLLTGDGMGVPYHVSKRLNTKGGDFVCVVGVGPIGLGNAMMQSFLGAEVIAIDINDYRLSLAQQFGAAHAVNSKQTDPIEAVKEITHGMLADKCIEAVGRPETVKLALKLVGKAGAVVTLGEQGDVPVNISGDLIRRDIALMGSWFYHYSEYPAIVDLYRRGLPVAKLITDHFPLTEAQAAFTKFSKGQAGKVMLEP